MIATFETDANDLDVQFLESLKQMFRDSRIRIKVELHGQSVPSRDEIESRMRHVESGGELIEIPASVLEAMATGEDDAQ